MIEQTFAIKITFIIFSHDVSNMNLDIRIESALG